MHDLIEIECICCARLRSVSDRVRLNIAFSVYIKHKKVKVLATQRLLALFEPCFHDAKNQSETSDEERIESQIVKM